MAQSEPESASIADLVTRHYGSTGLAATIRRALAEHGVDVEHLTVGDLSPVDQLHAGFAGATQHVLDRLGIREGIRLLDVGSGIGGPSRLAAAAGARVTGVDLTPEFVQTATELSEWTGLAGQTEFKVTPSDVLAVPDASFDAAMMIHVGMNVPDKQALFAEVHRALVPGGWFAVYDQMRAADGVLPWPQPWAEDDRSSFVQAPEEYAAQLAAAGFTVEETENRTDATAGPPPPGLTAGVVFGEAFMQRIGNNVAATRDGLLGAFLILARKG
ncbi:MAG TPA: methyltransferase domain-containing protein [Nocardioidaceae bacterium]|nr:methyltransferase domain-containing protein [Nocardioidaceae bacterium]